MTTLLKATYWIACYPAKGKGRSKRLPIPRTMRSTKFECLLAAAEWGRQDWYEMFKEQGFECIKVTLRVSK
jgi:hypothetical protein